MDRVFILRVLFFFSSLICLRQLPADTLKIVDHGQMTEDAKSQGNSWKSDPSAGYVSGGGVGQRLGFRHEVGPGKCIVTGEIALENPGHTAAGLCIGAEYFGFDGKQGLFIEGGQFGSTTFVKGPEIRPGEFFHFRLVRDQGRISLSLDGKPVIERDYGNNVIAGIALRPHRSQMRVRNFSVAGEIRELEELNRLFACGEEGYKSYRIPALLSTDRGTLLAFCEGRKNHAGDHGDIDVVLKRSTDDGETWSDLEVVIDHGKHVAGNPVPIMDFRTGRILLLACLSSHSEGAIYRGEGRRSIVILHSDDDGLSWSKPRDITAGIYPDNWRWYATGPCSGIQIRQGRHAGRLVCPANHTVVEDGTDHNIFRAHSLYSDDGGKTWQLGESSAPGGNESSIAEVAPDLLIQSIRMQTHSKGLRGVRYSRDGGESWSELEHALALPCPRCQAAVTRDYRQPGRLIHSNPGTSNGRRQLTLRLSEDGGKSWPYAKLIRPSSSAYSDTALTKDGDIAVLYEGGHYDYAAEGIIFELHTLKSIVE